MDSDSADGVREELWPLPDEEMPKDREWTSTEWQRNQRYLMNLLIDSLEEENAVLRKQVRAMERVTPRPPAISVWKRLKDALTGVFSSNIHWVD